MSQRYAALRSSAVIVGSSSEEVSPSRRYTGERKAWSRAARYGFTVTECTPRPSRARMLEARPAASVFPSPVSISAIAPPAITSPHAIWLARGESPVLRRQASA
ncbi:hypothetical protein D3C71_1577240 [compost metagenome]